uniref:putative reverse transcriptase/maturase n=1 Tax=Erythrolobus coxiae TaxID=362235 RepID=UPI001FCDB61F|nr:putative reverse transcriptase/maturase [Erythrolobus coxiae]UNJ17700.1 putative reverse transcriptase/maturase [Erythrolobus coxiae]
MIKSKKSQSIYYPAKEKQWTGIKWSKVNKTIENLQYRITKAIKHNQYRKARNLQRLLNRSISTRLQAVKIVSRNNMGGSISGIDGEIWNNAEKKLQVALELRKRSKTQPLKRITLSKFYEKSKNLGFSCMSDRAKQAVCSISLLPSLEKTTYLDYIKNADYYNDSLWMLNRTISSSFLTAKSHRWILKLTIDPVLNPVACQWILNNISMESKLLESWLTIGNIEKSSPKCFSIYPLLIDFILNSLDNCFKEKFICNEVEFGNNQDSITKSIKITRYANTFLITAINKNQIEKVKIELDQFIRSKGLQITENEINVYNIYSGFDFLGWHFKKYPKFLCQISKQSLLKHKLEIKYLIKNIHNPILLINTINAKINAWMIYNCPCDNVSRVAGKMNTYLHHRLIKWAMRRHNNKTKKWIFRHYWKNINGRLVFSIQCNAKNYFLMNYKKYKP